ncbi:hypothetical protein [Aquimarina sp. MMG016]|uniref:hypothetical protein n=1 Tax=Aquimarina sp. MMG016 TaxID=2822690 RepID=UPI001B3A459B|nr:hypothetical protein [Aquimarina sp. MMG016]MBQ4819286.1 hypothetical protein [Aquimarina sp. MMG016]
MKSILTIYILVLFSSYVINADYYCSPRRMPLSKIKISNYNLIKGYFIPHDRSNVHLAKFFVLSSSDSLYCDNQAYPVYQYGPFGSKCEKYEMGQSPLPDINCGSDKTRYLIVYKNRGDGERIVTPIFYGKGLEIDINGDMIRDYYEYTSLCEFENYFIHNTRNDSVSFYALKK